MKYLLLSALLTSVLFSCCKKSSDQHTDAQVAETPGTVRIGGAEYPYVVIGTQIWTSVNYNGAGGVNYSNGPNDPKYGKLYTWAGSKTIVLPEKWRLPTKMDFEKLMLAVGNPTQVNENMLLPKEGAEKLMSTSGWDSAQGSNQSGLNVYPTGLGTWLGTGFDYLGKGLTTALRGAPYQAAPSGNVEAYWV